MMQSAREAAFKALQRCRRDGAWSSASIDSAIKANELDARDAALASRICLGVLQNTTLLDFYIDSYADKKLEPKLRDILRTGVYQLIFMDKIPARAAVNETVALCKRLGCARASGLVNAVMRKLADSDKLPEIPGKGTAEYLSVKYSHPLWLCERIISEHNYAFAESFLAENNEASKLWIQVNTLKVSTDTFCRALDLRNISYEREGKIDGLLCLNGGRVTELPGFEDGFFYVQDKAARTAAEIAGAMPGWKLLDVCAAPGGKSFASAIRMDNCGEIISCDIHEKKLRLIENGAERLGIDIIETQTRDGRVYDEAMDEAFDLVIADVPCSGLGVIRKKPEIRWKSEQELSNLPAIQTAILENVCRYVKHGGYLLYSTCTVLKCENEEIVTDFVKRHPEFELVPFEGADIGMYCFWPHIDNSDGFFAAKLRKK